MQEKIYLRPLCLSDVNEKYLSWVNDPVVTENLNIGLNRLTHTDLVKYVEDSPKEGRNNYAIITEHSQQHIGNCSIYFIKPSLFSLALSIVMPLLVSNKPIVLFLNPTIKSI